MSPASPSPYGGRGPLVLGITWSETGLAFILIILRAQTASIRPRESLVDRLGVYRLRWDFIWVILAFAK
ncbi:hypothetical protein N7456_012042 [Penicillium angulare]|uniref:Uncharacterized protein n=1 Tax=Penicillium angulare TaxID=116970 RepID=A0A9W9K0R0_9EURO|nr:hypothetical protein N7456_012042 [Penicillium angulare]